MNTIDHDADAGGDAFVLCPGVLVPDWSFVTDGAARAALAAVMANAGPAQKWAELDPAEHRVWQALLRALAITGRAPGTKSLAASAGLDEVAVSGWLRSLRQRDMVVLDGASSVTAAYPFCAWATGHRIRFGAQTVNSLCAIDVLGAGAMVARDTTTESSCPECGAEIRVATRNNGHDLEAMTPASAVVWSGIRYADNCAATSGCTVKRFFCSDGHLQAWRDRVDPKGNGFRL